MKKVIFLGSKAIGLVCLEELFARQKELGCEIVAVGTSKRAAGIDKFCQKNGILEIHEIDEICSLQCDVLLSVQYHRILRQEHLNTAKTAINLHLAPLPEYRGCNQFSFAILNDEEEFGVTLHKMDCGIDSGDIIFQKRFDIPKNCFVGDLVGLAEREGIALFKEKLPALISGDYEAIPQKHIKSKRKEFHYRAEIETLKRIDFSVLASAGGGGDLIEKIIRATAMSGFEPPYCFIAGRKFYFIESGDCRLQNGEKCENR